MANAPGLVVSADQVTITENDPLEHEEFDAVHALDPERRRPQYYISHKILGKLYRAIDETKFMNAMHSRLSTTSKPPGSKSLLDELWAYVKRNVRYIQWNHLLPLAQQIRDSYENSLMDTMYTYSPHLREPLSELEVFAGTILGRLGGLPNKRTRDRAISMKDHFERNVAFHIDWIQHGEIPDKYGTVMYFGDQSEALERSVACLGLAMEEEGQSRRGIGRVKSFAYVAAAVCLEEVSDLGRSGRR